MATQPVQNILSDSYEAVLNGSDFSGIVVNTGIYPIEIFVGAVGATPAKTMTGLKLNPGEKLPIDIPPEEQLFSKLCGADFMSSIQLV